MRKRLYFLLPNAEEARETVDKLLLARIDDQHIHVMTKEDSDLSDLPPANLFKSNDIVHSVETGFIVGGLFGLIGSSITISTLQIGTEMGLIILGCTVFGAGFGAWLSDIIGSGTKNTTLKGFEKAMDDGKTLIITDVPIEKVKSIMSTIQAHKQTIMDSSESSTPAFP